MVYRGRLHPGEPDEPSLFLGYWGDLGTPKKMQLGNWLKSGDLAIRDENGYFWYQGRNDDLIKSAGYRIGPNEVEDALVRHPDVAEAAVIAKPDPDRGTVVMAYVRLMNSVPATDETKVRLQEFVKQNLAVYKYPRIIEFVDSFPMTSSGKFDAKHFGSKLSGNLKHKRLKSRTKHGVRAVLYPAIIRRHRRHLPGSSSRRNF